MNKSVLILTGTSNIKRTPEEIDNTMEEVFDLTLLSKQKYAKKHGYDLLTMRSFWPDKNKIFDDKQIGFLRVLCAFDMLSNYDVVMWVDADAIITNQELKIQDFQLDEEHSLYVSYDWAGMSSFSTGNFILQKTKYIEDLYKTFVGIGKQVYEGNHWGEEQTTFNHIYKATPLKNTIKILEHNYLNAVPIQVMESEFWANRQPVRWPWNESSFLAHITAVSNKHRIHILETAFDRYI